MKKILSLAVLSTFAFTGCASIGVGPYVVDGFIVGSTKGPLTATSNTGTVKQGTACVQNVLGLFAWGDSSIHAAKMHGNITKVTSVDYERFSVLGLFAKVCTQVRGE